MKILEANEIWVTTNADDSKRMQQEIIRNMKMKTEAYPGTAEPEPKAYEKPVELYAIYRSLGDSIIAVRTSKDAILNYAEDSNITLKNYLEGEFKILKFDAVNFREISEE